MLDYHKQESEAPSFHQITKVFRILDSTYAKKNKFKSQMCRVLKRLLCENADGSYSGHALLLLILVGKKFQGQKCN